MREGGGRGEAAPTRGAAANGRRVRRCLPVPVLTDLSVILPPYQSAQRSSAAANEIAGKGLGRRGRWGVEGARARSARHCGAGRG